MSQGQVHGPHWRGRPEAVPKRGMEPLADVLAGVVRQVTGKRARVADEIASAWQDVVSDRVCQHTRPVGMRRGVLTIEVANSVLLQELAAFRKEWILNGLRQRVRRVYINDLRFRLGGTPPAQA